MRMALKWRRHPEYPIRVIIGQADELPDSRCWFLIVKLNNGDFSIQLPALRSEALDKRFIMRDAKIAREFCEDYLNYNLKEIIKNQLREMRNTNQHPMQPPKHYEMLLQKYERLMENHKTPPNIAA